MNGQQQKPTALTDASTHSHTPTQTQYYTEPDKRVIILHTSLSIVVVVHTHFVRIWTGNKYCTWQQNSKKKKQKMPNLGIISI